MPAEGGANDFPSSKINVCPDFLIEEVTALPPVSLTTTGKAEPSKP